MTVLIFFVVLFVLVLAHEFGHFIVAKRAGIRVDEFGIGFPPKLFGKRYGETEYTLNALPIGGFVRIYGEDPTEEHYDGPESERSFVRKPRYVQAAVLVAGVAMNVALAFVLYSSVFMLGMPTALDLDDPEIPLNEARLLVSSVVPDSPADEVLKASDEILFVSNGEETIEASDQALSPRTVSDLIARSANKEVSFVVLRHDEQVKLTVIPQTGVLSEDLDRAAAGFSMSLVGLVRLPFFAAIAAGAAQTYAMLTDIIVGLGVFFAEAFTGEADFEQVGSVIVIAQMTGDAAALGLTWLLTFTAFISLNLAVINILPIPALDGGRLLFVAIESVLRRPIKPVIATRTNQIGFIALLTLMVVLVAHDIVRLYF